MSIAHLAASSTSWESFAAIDDLQCVVVQFHRLASIVAASSIYAGSQGHLRQELFGKAIGNADMPKIYWTL